MPTAAKLNDKLIGEAVNSAVAEFVQRRNRLRLLELEGQVEFHADWDYKKLRGKR